MNEVFENNTALASVEHFFSKYRKFILIFSIFIVVSLAAYFAFKQIAKNNNEKAGAIFNEWVAQEIESEDGSIIADKLFNQLTNSYKKTGYSKIALLNQASIDAKNGEISNALEKFILLIEVTDGYGGNKLFNKIARINTARLYYDQQKYDAALQTLEKYSNSSNALIHELIGDILTKQEKVELAREQYVIAKDKYSDQTSISIVAMKISNLAL
ncbi:tetratricopeptide repeat protein [Gammaproteobacteria bacterium]|jgi:predicted negative regulator of RcsB-dependent stress response|nr:tetratricopeptide repeat protein [Gammaproteobacteria bacterium]